jgi:transposase
MQNTVFVGIDIAKRKFDVALLLGQKCRNKVFSNDPDGFAALLGWMRAHTAEPVHVCMEATGSYGEALALYLSEAGVLVSVVNPFQIAKFAQALGARNKSDRQDARTIARFCQTQCPPAWQAPAPEVRALRELVRRLDAVLDLQRQELNRLELAGPATRASIEALLGVLDEQVRKLKSAIAEHIDGHPGLKTQADLLQTIPGVAEATLRVILAELPPGALASVRAADAFTGLAPRVFESGTLRARSMMSKRGTPRLRKALYFPAIVACRHNPVVKVFYQRMLQNGLTKKQAVCAAMRKLLHLVVGVLKSGKPFDPSLHNLKSA